MQAAKDPYQFPLANIEHMRDAEIIDFESRNGLKVSFIAADQGHEAAVRDLINRGFEVDCELNGETPIEVAFARKYFKIVLSLLRANSRFPRNLSFESAPDELKIFLKMTKTFHESIANEDEEKIVQIIAKNRSIRHFYNLQNKSAVRVAIESKKLNIYKLLIEHKIYIGPHEEMCMIVQPLDGKFRSKLRDLHCELSKSVISKPMMTIARNCFIGPDVEDQEENFDFIHEALRYLFSIPSIAKYLEVVAASRKFKIIFDFNRETCEYLDPSFDCRANGVFYFNGKIFIGAKNLLDPSKKLEIYGVIAHELCHYAMFLVFNNLAKPYYKNEGRKFEMIVKASRGVEEEVVRAVFDYYSQEFHHSELIARAPQLLALYHENQKVLEKEELKPLLNYFESEIVPEVEKALPRVKAKFLSENERKIKRQRKIIFSLGALLLFCLLMAIPLSFWLYTPFYSWKTLTDDEKILFKSSKISYNGTEIEFGKLFRNDSEIFDHLSSDHIRRALEGDTSSLAEEINSVYDQFVIFEWRNMTESLREKFVTSNFTFQGSNVKFCEILALNSSALKFLPPDEIRKTLRGESFNVSREINKKSKFFYPRKFINEKLDEKLVAEFIQENWGLYDFDETDEAFLKLKLLDKIKTKSAEEIFNEVNLSHIFLLSSPAGEGKSTTFRHFWFKLKEKNPGKWIEFVDLKRHILAFDKGQKMILENRENLTNFLADDLLQLKSFERELFVELFVTDRVVFLWDGIDEVSPQFNEFMLNLVSNVKSLTSNHQFVSTRPQHSEEYQERLIIEAQELLPLNSTEKFKFLAFSLASRFDLNITEENLKLSGNESSVKKFNEAFKKSEELFKQIESSVDENFVNNPLLILMVAEIVTSDKILLNGNFNFYQLYDIFIDKKLNITSNKGEIVKEDSRRISKNPFVNLMEIHQIYALKVLKPDLTEKIENLSSNETVKITNLEITRYGILTVVSESDFEFIHRTFAEFFYAQFLISHMKLIDTKPEDFLPILNFGFYGFESANVIRKFLNSYMTSTKELPKALEYIKKQEAIENQSLNTLITFADFAYYIKSQKILNVSKNIFDELHLHVNQEICDNLINSWDEILTKFGDQKLKSLFYIVNAANYSFLTLSFMHCDKESNLEILTKLNETLGYELVLERILFTTDYGQNVLLNAAVYGHFESAWYSIENFFKDEDQKIILRAKGDQSVSVLESTTWHRGQNKIHFPLAVSAYFRLLSKEEMIEDLLRETGRGLVPILYFKIIQDMSEVCDELLSFTEELFEGNAVMIEQFLNTKNVKGETIFTHFKETENESSLECINKLKSLYE